MSTVTVKTDSAIKKALADPEITRIVVSGQPIFLLPRKDRKSATWYVSFYQDGKQQKSFAKFPGINLKEAIELKKVIMPKMLENEKMMPNAFKTMNELFDWYTSNMGKKGVHRQQSIINSIKYHLKPFFGSILIDEFCKLDVYKFFRDEEKKYKVSTIRLNFSVLKQILVQAKNLEIIEDNILLSSKFSMYTESKIEPRVGRLDWRNIDKTYRSIISCSYVPARVFNLFCLMMGTRLSETRKLKWDEIDFDSSEVILLSENVKNRQQHVLPMTPQIHSILSEYKIWQKQRYQGEFLFFDRNGSYISRSVAENYVSKISKKKWSAHDYRKLIVDSLIRLGVDQFISERIINHKMTMLQRAYPAKELKERMGQSLLLWHDYLSRFSTIGQKNYRKSKKKPNGDEALLCLAS